MTSTMTPLDTPRQTATDAIRPFQFHASDEDLADLRQRIKATRWPEKEPVAGFSQGVPLATMQKLARYWTTEYDWRKVEAKLNSYPQFITNIDGLDILFFRTDVNEMDVQPVDIRDELRIAIELRLDLAPIVFRRPIAGKLLHRRERHALREIGDGLFFGPPRRFDPPAEIREVLVRGVKLEGADGVCCGLSCGVERRHGAGHCVLLPKGAAASSTKLHAPAAAVVRNLRGS